MIKIVNVEGPIPDPQTFQPYLRVTADCQMQVTQVGRTEQENALFIYTALNEAWAEWNKKVEHVPKEA